MLAHPYEKYAHKVLYPCTVQPKLDGCFKYGTLIDTEIGKLPIGEVVDKQLPLKVWSYNIQNDSFELKKITNWWNNGLGSSDEFMTVIPEGGLPTVCTKNHKFFTEGLICWKRADELEKEDKIFSVENYKTLVGVFLGMVWGDGGVYFDKRSPTLSCRMNFSVSEKDEDYGDFKEKVLSDIVSFSKKPYTSGYGSACVQYNSKALTKSALPISDIYDTEKGSPTFGKRKDLSFTELNRMFTDETLGFIYLDDGSLHWNNGSDKTPRVFLSVAGLSKNNIEVLSEVLKFRYKVDPVVSVYGRDTRMSFNTKDSVYLLYRIAKVLSGALDRKLLFTYQKQEFSFKRKFLPVKKIP